MPKILTEVVAPAVQMKVKILKSIVQYVVWNILLVMLVSSVAAKQMIAGCSATVVMTGLRKFVFLWLLILKKVWVHEGSYYFTLQNKNVFSMNKCSVIFS